jgi:hypothetical protein
MSKQRYFSNFDKLIKMEISKKVLKRQGYKCLKCGVPHKAKVIRHSDHYSEPLDQHEENFMINSGIKPIRIILCVLARTGFENSQDPAHYDAYCPIHTQERLKATIAAIKKKRIGDLSNPAIRHVVEIKNFIFSCTGKMITTREAIGLIMRVSQSLKNE